MQHVAILAYIDDPFDPVGENRMGGGHLFLFDLSRYLVRNGFRLTFVSRRNSPDKPVLDELSPRFAIHRLAVGEPAEIGTDALAELLPDLQRVTEGIFAGLPDLEVIHSYHWTAGETACCLSAQRRLRHVHTVLSIGRPKLPAPGVFPSAAQAIRDRCESLVFASSAELLVTCPAERDEIIAFYPEAATASFRVIPHGVNPDVFHPWPETANDYLRRATRRFQQGVGDLP